MNNINRRSFTFSVLASGAVAVAPWRSALARKTVDVVASVPGLGAIVSAVGGSHVSVKSLAQPTQDPHFVDARPNFVTDLNRADLFVQVGLGLEQGWLPGLLTNARNTKIAPGAAGYLDASQVAGKILRGAAVADRSMGDVHPQGNPHYLYDPNYAVRIADGVAKRLASIDPKNAASYKKNAADFTSTLKRKIVTWEKDMKPYKGRKIVGYHMSLMYLVRWLDLDAIGFVEPLPGISPNPRHLAKLITSMRSKGARVVVMEPWYNAKSARIVAEKTKSEIVRLPGDVGTDGIKDYVALIDAIVDRMQTAMKKTT